MAAAVLLISAPSNAAVHFGLPSAVKSTVKELKSIKHEKDIEQAISSNLQAQSSGRQYYATLLSQGDPDVLQKTVSYLKSQPTVTDASVGEDGISIWVKYSSGLEGVILTQSFIFSGNQTSIQSKASRIAGLHISGNRFSTSPSTTKKALILLPVDSVPGYQDESIPSLVSSLENSGYSIDIFRDKEVTVDLMKTLSDYNFVYMATHGGVGITSISIMTGQVADRSTLSGFFHNTMEWWLTSGLVIVSVPGLNESYFGLNKNFFSKYKYANSLVFMNACSSLKNTSLADAFLDNGAGVYLGWNEVAFLELGNIYWPKFFQEFSKPHMALEQAYSSIISQYFPAIIYKDDDHDGEFRVKMKDGNTLNSDQDDFTFNYNLTLLKKGNSGYVLNPNDPPTVPANLYATAVSSKQINLVWEDKSNNEDEFKIERKTGAGGTYSQIVAVNAGVQGYSDLGLSAGTTYYYRVRASNSDGNSDYSNEASTATLPALGGGQNDAGSGGDAGNSFSTALSISPGNYTGYLDNSDVDDYYKFSVTAGQLINISMSPPGGADFDLKLYDPSGTEKASSALSGTDNVSFTAGSSGYWRARIFYYSGSGNYSFGVTVGDPAVAWSTPQEPVGAYAYADKVAIAADTNNNIYIVYWAHNGSFNNLRYTKFNGTSWSVPSILDTAISDAPSIAIDSGGNVHIVYSATGGTELRYIKLASDGTAHGDIIFNSGGTEFKPRIAVDSLGIPHIFCNYYGFGLIHLWKDSSWVWDTAPIYNAPYSNAKVGIAIDNSNNVHVCYPTNYAIALTYRKRVGGVWQSPETVNTDASSIYSSIAVDSGGNPHITYQHIGTSNLVYTNKLGGSWTTVAYLSSYYDLNSSNESSLVVDSAGAPHVVYLKGGSGSQVLMYATTTGDPSIVTEAAWNGTSTGIALDSTGHLHVAYANGTNLFYTKK